MANYDVYDLKAAKVGEVELADEVFACEVNTQAIFDAVLRQQSSWRQGTHKVKNRREVSGGGKKPFRQKGTGRHRQGSSTDPSQVGGGVVFAPKPRDYTVTLNKKVKRLAMKSALSSKVQDNEMIVVDSIATEGYKTKKIAEMLKALGSEKKALIVLSEVDAQVIASAANIPGVKTAQVNTLNVYDILNADKFIVVKDAVSKIEEVYA